MPDNITNTLLVPLVKNKKGNLSLSDHCWPLAITCISSKMLQLLVLDRYEHLLKTTDNHVKMNISLRN